MTFRIIRKPGTRPVFGLVLLALLAACGGQPRQISGELPLIQLDGLSLDEHGVHFDIGIRNINDRSLQLPGLTLRLDLDDRRVAELNQPQPGITIAARGREVMRLETSIDDRGRRLLESLTAGERSNLAYQLELELDGQRRRRLDDTISRGFLHAVPGQAGRFR